MAVTLGYCSFACSTARYSAEPGAPSIVLPARFAEGTGEPGKAPSPPPSAAPGPHEPPSKAEPSGKVTVKPSNLPDPTPLRMAEQVEYELELNEGKIRVASAKPVKLAAPIVTPRRMGRYAVELSIGPELIERLRFDFPATAADEPLKPGQPKPLSAPLTLSERAIARVKLLVPHSPRVRRAVLVDRALQTVTELEWPLPEVARTTPTSTAGSVDAAAPEIAPAPAPQP